MSLDDRTDAELVAEVLAGRQELYAVLVNRYQEPLYRHALGMVSQPDAAADLVQDSLVKAYTSLDGCRDPDRFGAWVFRIARNKCLDYLKNHRRRNVPLTEATAYAPSGDDPETRLELSEVRRDVTRALDTLPEAQREAFLLKHVEGRSYDEMAELLEASVSALKMRVKRAREALQAALGGAGDTTEDVTAPSARSSTGQEAMDVTDSRDVR